MRKFAPFILLPLLASLLNSNVFGNPTLFAWFFYILFSGIIAVTIYSILLFSSKHPIRIPVYSLLLLVFIGYTLLHGVFKSYTSFTHYFWVANAFLFLSCFFLFTSSPQYFLKAIFKGITFIVLFECLVVLLQCITILPVNNDFFLCTGTWANPNVTAIFLSFSLFAVLQIFKTISRPLLTNALLIIILSSILLLYSRTANLVALLFIANYFKTPVKNFFKKKLRFTINNIALATFLFIGLMIFLLPFVNKQKSMDARKGIWKNSIQLAVKKPLTGYGFGQFEKEYNLFAASQMDPGNSHINMAYNDFLELTIEGGFPALFLWCGFLFSFVRFCIHNKRSILPIVAVVIIQLFNFGFQALPAMVLFLIYTAAGNADINFIKKENNLSKNLEVKPSILKFVYLLMIAAGIFFSYKVANYTGAFYEQKKTHSDLKNRNAISSLKQLEPILFFSSDYHENFGDAYMARRQFALAIQQYKQALQSCSRTDVFAKIGYCFRMINQYDSSESYCQIVQNIEPQKLIPRMALLQLFQQKKDTLQIVKKANEIIEMPMPIVSKRGLEIKKYAENVLLKIDSINISRQKIVDM